MDSSYQSIDLNEWPALYEACIEDAAQRLDRLQAEKDRAEAQHIDEVVRANQTRENYPFEAPDGTPRAPDDLTTRERELCQTVACKLDGGDLSRQQALLLGAYRYEGERRFLDDTIPLRDLQALAQTGQLPGESKRGMVEKFRRKRLAQKILRDNEPEDLSARYYNDRICTLFAQEQALEKVRSVANDLRTQSDALTKFQADKPYLFLAIESLQAASVDKLFFPDLSNRLPRSDELSLTMQASYAHKANTEIADRYETPPQRDPAFVDPIVKELARCEIGRQLLGFAREHNVAILTCEMPHDDAPFAYVLSTKPNEVVLNKSKMRSLSEWAPTLGHELRHTWQILVHGDLIKEGKKASPLLTTRLEELDAYAIEDGIKDQLASATPEVAPEPDALWSSLAASFLMQADPRRTNIISAYDINYLREITMHEICQSWDKTVSDHPLLQPAALQKFLSLPNGKTYCPVQIAHLVQNALSVKSTNLVKKTELGAKTEPYYPNDAWLPRPGSAAGNQPA